jgi:Domain of unknown function (DUF4082)/Bacterial Ig-like domain (group 1)
MRSHRNDLNRLRRDLLRLRKGWPAFLAALLFACTVSLAPAAQAQVAQSLFTTQTPALPNVSDGVSYELGMKFRVARAGSVVALRYWKAPGDSAAQHVGNLWAVSGTGGTLLGSAAFAGETASGWQQQALSSAVAVQPGVTYMVSVNTADYFADTPAGLAASIVNGDLSSVADGANGNFGAAGSFPTGTYNNGNYFRDVVFQALAVPTIAKAAGDGQTAPAGSVLPTPLTVTVADANGAPIVGTTVTFAVTAGGGTLSATALATDVSGQAVTTLTLGATAGANTVHATAAGVPGSVDFAEAGTAASVSGETLFVSQVPTLANVSDGVPYELGMKFQVARAGTIGAIRYWKAPSDTGVHTGRLWAVNGPSGTQIASVVFSSESASGWQQQSLPNPVAVQPGTTYVVSVNSAGYFVDTPGGLATSIVNGDLSSVGDGRNGVFGATGSYPSGSYNNSNYFRDVVYAAAPVTTLAKISGDGQTGSAGSPLSAPFTVAVVAADGTPVAGALVTFSVAAGGGTLSVTGAATDATGRASSLLTLGTAGGTNSVHVTATGIANAVDFTAIAAAVGESLFTTQLPQLPDAQDGVSYELGMKFQSARNGSVAALRFWKSPSETGTHVGHLWAVDGTGGTLLASAPFSAETASGWQQQDFATPVPIQANTTYVVSVNANAHYPITLSGLAPTEGSSGIANADLSAVADGANGLFGASGAYPTGSFRNSNYFRDVVFQPVPAPFIAKSGGDAQSAPAGTSLPTPITVTVADANDTPLPGIAVTFSVVAGGGTVAPTVVPTDATGHASATWTVGAQPGPNTLFVSANGISGGIDFTATATPSQVAGESLFTSQVPALPSASDGVPYELGMKFQATRSGNVLALRYWKAAGETGTHVGHLWTVDGSPGSLLASVAFANETASGWQQQALPVPVPLSANTTYAVSVNTNGLFADTPAGLSAGIANGDLLSVADDANGLFGSPGAFPTQSYRASNYFRDIVFAPSVLTGLAIESGAGQAGTPGSPLPQPFVVRLRDANGNPAPGAAVTFSVTAGGGTVAPATATTDADGLASTVLTLGPTPGPDRVVAASGGYSVTFSATAANAIWLENQKPGTSGWQISNQVSGTNPEILGYAGATSVNLGENLPIMVSLATPGAYTVDVYRLGWYAGIGARKVHSSGPLAGSTQGPCAVTDPSTLLIECPWTTSYTVPITGGDWTTGLYIANLTEASSGKQTQVWFVVRDDASRADILFQSAFATYQAYNDFGTTEQHSLYPFNSSGGVRAYQVSFDRPFAVNSIDPGRYDRLTSYEYNMVRWMESQGYDVAYATSIDLAAKGSALLAGHKVFMDAGHDEYWSAEMRDAVEGARDNGTANLAFFSGNSSYWRVRFEPSSSGVPNRVMTCYKDAGADPLGNTVRWRDAPNGRPENAMMGVMYVGDDSSNVYGGYPYVVTNASDPYYRNTGVVEGAALGPLVGYEWDGIVDNGATPAGLVVLGDSPAYATVVDPLLPVTTDPNLSNAVRYTAPSGAKVFAAGSIQWAWGLDSFGVKLPRASPQIQQMFVNILSDLGAKPASPSAGLVVP